MTVSLAMIVKNEELTLGRCLDSVHGAVDEIVIVDTGSSDATLDVARRYTDRVFSFPWRDDFALARQFAFDQATSDWICWLDADDIVLGAANIRATIASAAVNVGGFHWRYVCARDRWGNPTSEFWRERCVRNDGSFRWQGRIHETLGSDSPWQMRRSDAVLVEHHSPADRNESRGRRNLSLLEKDFEESKGRPSARLLFYLGREYAGLGDLDKAVDMLGRCIDTSGWDEERYMARLELSALYRRHNQLENAIEADLMALKICPHWPNAYFSLAESYYYLQDWHKVVHWCEVGRAMPPPDSSHIMDPTTYRYGWIIFYTNALFQVGAIGEARVWTQRALSQCPGDEQHIANLGFFSQAAVDVGQAS